MPFRKSEGPSSPPSSVERDFLVQRRCKLYELDGPSGDWRPLCVGFARVDRGKREIQLWNVNMDSVERVIGIGDDWDGTYREEGARLHKTYDNTEVALSFQSVAGCHDTVKEVKEVVFAHLSEGRASPSMSAQDSRSIDGTAVSSDDMVPSTPWSTTTVLTCLPTLAKLLEDELSQRSALALTILLSPPFLEEWCPRMVRIVSKLVCSLSTNSVLADAEAVELAFLMALIPKALAFTIPEVQLLLESPLEVLDAMVKVLELAMPHSPTHLATIEAQRSLAALSVVGNDLLEECVNRIITICHIRDCILPLHLSPQVNATLMLPPDAPFSAALSAPQRALVYELALKVLREGNSAAIDTLMEVAPVLQSMRSISIPPPLLVTSVAELCVDDGLQRLYGERLTACPSDATACMSLLDCVVGPFIACVSCLLPEIVVQLLESVVALSVRHAVILLSNKQVMVALLDAISSTSDATGKVSPAMCVDILRCVLREDIETIELEVWNSIHPNQAIGMRPPDQREPWEAASSYGTTGALFTAGAAGIEETVFSIVVERVSDSSITAKGARPFCCTRSGHHRQQPAGGVPSSVWVANS